MWKPKLDPITQKRLARFRSLKRAYWSLWILAGLYLCALLANFLSNDKPLLVKFEGDYYFPIFSYYPDDVFTASGLSTRPDYKEISQREEFGEGTGNYMIFAPIPYGPLEVVGPEQIETDETIYISFGRQQRVATLNLDSDKIVKRSSGFTAFVGGESDRDLRNRPASDWLEIPSEIVDAVGARLANESEQPSVSTEAILSNGVGVELSLTPYKPRSRPPTSARVTVREKLETSNKSEVGLLDGEVSFGEQYWLSLDSKSREALLARSAQLDQGLVEPLAFENAGINYRATFQREEAKFPFRPTGDHWLGLDSSGRDVLSRILYALRISLNFGLLLVVTTLGIGVLVGGIQGYRGGKVDLFGQRLTEIWEALPFLYIMILVGSIYGRGFGILLLIYGLFNWVSISYYMRGEFLKLRKQPFVEAARCLGLSDWKIMSRHILPNALVPLITFFPFSLVGAIFSLSALDFLGFGLPPPTPSWGELLSQAQEFKKAWWLVLYPSLALFVVILLGVFIGEGIRAAFDPRVNSRYES